jgi:cytosine/adenosine deaminase-related metal-dependent hydrolase
MITLIKGSWVIAFDGEKHRLISDGEIAFEDDKIIFVGKNFNGKPDKFINAKGRLISPGFINVHALANICITHFRIDGLTEGGVIPNYKEMLMNIEDPNYHLKVEEIKLSSLFSFIELLKGGSTTIVEITAFGTNGLQPPREQAEEFVKVATDLGARSYISHPYTDMKKYKNKRGETEYYHEQEGGFKAFDAGVGFCNEYEGANNGLIRTMLFPYMFDACSTELLQETRRKAGELDLPVHMHTAQYPAEYYESLRRYGKTPVHQLSDIGFLAPKTILTHLLYTSLNPTSQAPGLPIGDPRDIRMLAESDTTLGHTPLVWARIGKTLHSYAIFRDLGVNIGIGTDAWPMDMLMEMRWAITTAKIVEGSRTAVTAADVFNAATLGGSRALGRNDIGRLCPGAKADMLIINMSSFHTSLIDDPVKSLIYFGNQDDIETVIINGRTVIEKGLVPGIDLNKLSERANKVNQKWKERNGYKYPPSFTYTLRDS